MLLYPETWLHLLQLRPLLLRLLRMWRCPTSRMHLQTRLLRHDMHSRNSESVECCVFYMMCSLHGLCEQLLHLADACVQAQVQVLVPNVHHQAANDLRVDLRLQVQQLPLLQQLLKRRLGAGELLRCQRL